MSIHAKFNEMQFSVMATIYNLSQKMDIEYLFPLLPISRKEKDHEVGTVISAQYPSMTRGLIIKKPKKDGKPKGYLKNAIILYLKTEKKVFNFKIYNDKFHVCGIKSKEEASEAAQLMIEIVNNIQADLNYIRDNRIEYNLVLTWIRNTLCGSLIIQLQGYEPDSRAVMHSIKAVDAPACLDQQILKFVMNQVYDFKIYEDMIQQLELVPGWNIINMNSLWGEYDIRSIIYPPISILGSDPTMINYNYNLGGDIDLAILVEMFNGKDNFEVEYNNTSKCAAKLKLPYPRVGKYKNKKNTNHAFTVYQKGTVTQSGPSEELIEEAYTRFISIVEEIGPQLYKKRFGQYMKLC